MKTFVLTLILTAVSSVHSATTYPTAVSDYKLGSFPYRTSGIIWGNGWQGSGTVASHGKIAISCAHLVFDNGEWLTGFDWADAYSSSLHPDWVGAGKPLRGYWYWTSYSGGTASSQFHRDFVVHFAYDYLAGGAHSGTVRNNSNTAHPLTRTDISKMIVGYPGSDPYYMNSVGSFRSRYKASYGHNLWCSSVKGGPGKSGGGVFAYWSGQWRLAGVHVSGRADGGLGAGARALNDAAYSLMSYAKRSADTYGAEAAPVTSAAGASDLPISDASTAWTVTETTVKDTPGVISTITLDAKVHHARPQDLEVMVTSPAGRSVLLPLAVGVGATEVSFSGHDLGHSFRGTDANGTWKLSVRDQAEGVTGTVSGFTLHITTLD